MRISLLINGHEICDYVAEDGISVSKEERCSKQVTCMDGTLYDYYEEKLNISVTLQTPMLDSAYTTLCGYFTPNPAQVSYTNFETGQTKQGLFYIKSNNHGAKRSYGTVTELTNLSFNLVEK